MTQMRETHDPKCVRCIFENAARTCNSRLKVQKGEVCAFKPHSSDQFFSLVVEKRMTKKNSNTRRANTQEAMAEASSSAAAKAEVAEVVPTLFTREWVMNNPEAFRKLAAPPEECPVCMEPFGPDRAPLGPIMGDMPTSCRHYLCESCWIKCVKMPPTLCPLCREDVTDWYWKRMYVDWLQAITRHPHCTGELAERVAARRIELREILSFVHRDFFPL